MRYLDHAATTPIRPSALAAWRETAELTGNASSLHSAGRTTRRLVEDARERVAAALGVAPDEVVFTSGATESDNLAVTGTVRAAARSGRNVLITCAIEHKAVLEPAAALQSEGVKVALLGVDATGRADPAEVAELLAGNPGDVALVAVMAVNNEVGSVQDTAAIGAACRDAGAPFHVDAAQAVGTIPLDLSGVTTAAVSAHKVGGPMGVGVLTVSSTAQLEPLQRGGGHESGLRAGTHDVPGIVAASVAIAEAVSEQAAHAEHLRSLSSDLLAGLQASGLPAVVNSGQGRDSHPGIVHLSFPGCDADALVLLLDAAGVAVSTGAACSSGISRASHVLTAMGLPEDMARGAVRVSFGRTSVPADVSGLLDVLPGVVDRARRAGRSAQEVAG